MAAKINSLIMQNRLISQAKSGLRTKNTEIGKTINRNATSRTDRIKEQAAKKSGLSKSGLSKSGELSRDNYMVIKKSADSLIERAKQLLALPEGGIEELSEEQFSDYREKVLMQAEGLVGDYNALTKSMEEEGGAVNQIYLKQLQGYLKSAHEDLKAVGITSDKNGRLTLDKEALKAADVWKLKHILGTEGSFADKVGKRAENILSNAETNLAYINKSMYAGNYSYNRYGSDIFDAVGGSRKYSAKG